MGAREGRYGCTRGPIIGFESRAISARVTKQIVTIFSKTCDKAIYSQLSLVKYMCHLEINRKGQKIVTVFTETYPKVCVG